MEFHHGAGHRAGLWPAFSKQGLVLGAKPSLSRDGLRYLSAATDYQVSQVVDRTKGIHGMIRKSDFKNVVPAKK